MQPINIQPIVFEQKKANVIRGQFTQPTRSRTKTDVVFPLQRDGLKQNITMHQWLPAHAGETGNDH
jgi:hypothetical protein